MKGRETCLGVIDGRRDDEKLELACRESDTGALELELRLVSWGEGIGWYPQRTLALPPDLAGLRLLLRRGERRTGGLIRRQETRVLPFPRVWDARATSRLQLELLDRLTSLTATARDFWPRSRSNSSTWRRSS